MYKRSINTDFSVLAAANTLLGRVPALLLSGAAQRKLGKLRDDLEADLTTVPPRPPSLPFIWSNDPQAQAAALRWYFAAIGRGEIRTAGGRYQRSGEYVEAWIVDFESTAEGGGLVASNNSPALPFVGGSRQVPSHERTGWPNYLELFALYSRKAEALGIQLWFEVNDPFLEGRV